MPPSGVAPFDDYRRGARASLPLVPGALIFGLATGAATISGGVGEAAALVLPAAFYTGVAQLAFTQLWLAAAPFAAILLSVALTQLRYLIYATIASTWPRPKGLLMRLLAPYFITESSFALALPEPPDRQIRFMTGAGLPLWTAWVTACIAGTFVAGKLPPLKHAYAVPAIVLAPILTRQLTRQRLPVAMIAVVLGLALAWLPFRLGPLVAAGLAVLAVMALPALWERK